MQIFRIAKTAYIRDLTGTGAKRYGGRWNPKGVSLLYASEHRSLAILEILVNASMLSLPEDLSLLTLRIPDSETTHATAPADLPSNWRSSPAPFRLAEIGADWIASNKSLAMKVPSVIVPEEQNVLINPNHPDFETIRIESVSDFTLDSRFSDKYNKKI